MDKRGGIIMPLYVLLFLAMCGSAILMNLASQNNVRNSIASPLTVLEARDNLDEFEFAEKKVILDAYTQTIDSGIKLNTSEFLSEFRRTLLEDSYDNPTIRDYITSGVYDEGRKLSGDYVDWASFFDKELYPEDSFRFKDNSLVFTRSAVVKRYLLEAINTEDHINFKMGLDYGFAQEYSVALEGKAVRIFDGKGNVIY